MYQALYRKYRPSNFDEVVGQTVVVKTLKNAIIENKVTHAYLFTGPRGTGKTSIAKIFAKTINCTDQKDGIPCDKCVSCTQINNKTTTDIIEIDAASNNGVDEIRELKSKVTLVPNNSKYKVYIVDEVHMLTQGAFNALLKTLEEPPAHVIFILATTEPHKIPSTILSRCQRYDYKKISDIDIMNRLKYICEQEKIAIDSNALNEVARLADGGMRDAISILDQVISYKTTNITSEDVHIVNGTLTQKDLVPFIKAILNKDVETVFAKIDEYNNSGINLQKLIDEIILFFRNLLLYTKVPKYFKSKESNYDDYSELKEIVDDRKIYQVINNFNKLSSLLKTSTNPKIMFEVEILNNMNIFSNESININKENKTNIVKTSVKEEIKKEENNIILKNYDIDIEKFKEFKKIRINNILSKLSKKEMLKISEDRKKFKEFLLDKKYGKFASLLLDGAIKAGSEESILYVYEYDEDVNIFNNNIPDIEKFLESVINKKYNLIAVNQEEWEIIKNEFNSKEKKYIYQQEKYFPGNKINKDKKNDMEEMFENIVEYVKEEL